MKYKFWQENSDIIPYEYQIKFDVRLSNVEDKINSFFNKVMINIIEKTKVEFFLAGSCIKADIFRDIDMIFPIKSDKELVNNALDKAYFEYENNSYTYTYEEDIFQLVFRPKFENASLEFLVKSFDFASTKIAFLCELDTQKKQIHIKKCVVLKDFIDYLQTKENPLISMSANPFVSLQRAIHFLKRGDNVPYSSFLDVCSAIAELKIKENEDVNKHFERLQGNPKNLKGIKEAISHFIDEKR